MKLDNMRPSDNVEDRRGEGGIGFPQGGGRRINLPMGGRGGGISLKTIVLLVIVYLIAKLVFGVDLLQVINGGNPSGSGSGSEMTLPDTNTNVTADGGGGGTLTPGAAGTDEELVRRVLGSTEDIWSKIFGQEGQTYGAPRLVLFDGFVQSACGMAQSAMGPFYCPGDQKVYIDLSFYRDMKTKLGAPGDFAQAYVIAHEVGHHVQNLFGIATQVREQQSRSSTADANALSVRMELQADCLAGIWAKEANAMAAILEQGDLEEALNAASQIGDDRLQKRSQGYAVPESFTHGSSEQRMRWFKKGFGATSLSDCDTFQASSL
jgi:predicted metalloprotease